MIDLLQAKVDNQINQTDKQNNTMTRHCKWYIISKSNKIL